MENTALDHDRHREALEEARLRDVNQQIRSGSAVDKGLDLADRLYGKNSFKKWPFAAAGVVAILKDLLDFAFIGSLPGVGTVITVCASIFIGLMLILAGSYQKKKAASRAMKRYMVLIAGTIAEMFFGLNFVPIETIMVSMIYRMAKKEAKQKTL